MRLQHLKEEEDASLALEEKEREAKEEARAYFASFDDRDSEVRRKDLYFRDPYSLHSFLFHVILIFFFSVQMH